MGAPIGAARAAQSRVRRLRADRRRGARHRRVYPGAGKLKAEGKSVRALVTALERWYERDHRPLPWRATRDPYRILVSEVMLQQTRARAVIPYYQRFLRQFPDVKALAEAREADVLACWSGLGYYSRAR